MSANKTNLELLLEIYAGVKDGWKDDMERTDRKVVTA